MSGSSNLCNSTTVLGDCKTVVFEAVPTSTNAQVRPGNARICSKIPCIQTGQAAPRLRSSLLGMLERLRYDAPGSGGLEFLT
jgi:hypothetical protein